MLNSYFYHGLLRKYVIYFGTLFNDINIQRTDENEDVVQDFLVPIAYGPKQKFIARLEQEPDVNTNEASIVLPRLSFEITGFQYDATRKLPTLNRIVKQGSFPERISSVYTPVPYNITFQLAIYTKNAEDGMKILEQILPYFTPEWTSTIHVMPEIGLSLDIPVVLTGTSMSDQYQGNLNDMARRYIIHTLTFNMKGYFFGPIGSTGVIKRSIVNMYNNSLTRTADLSVTSYITDFKEGDRVFQYDGKSRSASGTVALANSSFIRVGSVSGKFTTQYNLQTDDSRAIATISSVTTANTPSEVITLRPTLTSANTPTANVSESIDLDLIKSTDNYGINISITEP